MNNTSLDKPKKSCSLLGSAEGSEKFVEKQKFKLQFAVSPEFMTKYKRVKELMSTRTPGGIKFEGAFEALMDEYIEKHSPEARVKRREAKAAKNMESAEKVEKVKSAVKAERSKREAAKQVGSAAETAAKPALRPETTVKAPAKGAKTPAKGAKDPGQPSQGTSPSRYIPQAIRDQVSRRYGGQCAYTSSDGHRCGSRWNLHVDHIVPFALGGSNEPENLQLLCRRHNQHKAIKDFGKKKMQRHSK